MKTQKVLSLILAAALCVSTPGSAMAADFTSGPEDSAVQVTTEATTEDVFTDSVDTTEKITENAEVTEFAPEVEDGEEDATRNAEAGSDIESATEISLNTRYTGAISDNNVADFYEIKLNSAGLLSVSGTIKGTSIVWTLYDDMGVEIINEGTYGPDTTGIGSFAPDVNLTKGTYYLSVSRYRYWQSSYEGKSSGTYAFKVGLKSANETIPEEQGGSNDTIDDADDISLNKTYKGQIAYNEDNDYYKFTVPKDEKVKAIWKGNDHNADRYVYYLYDSLGNCMDWAYMSNTTREWTLEAGDYYIRVNGSGYTGNYQFTLQTHSHKWKNEITKATLTQNGTIIQKCACGETGRITTIYRPKTVRLSKTRYKYNGYAQKPTVKVIGSDGKVISPSYYKVTYSRGLTAKGKYTVKITFKGRYSGSVKKYFKIV